MPRVHCGWSIHAADAAPGTVFAMMDHPIGQPSDTAVLEKPAPHRTRLSELEALQRRLAHCRDEAHELDLALVEYMLRLARHELGAALRRTRLSN